MKDKAIQEILEKESEEFRKLGEEHRSLDDKLGEINSKVYLTPEEELEKKRLQKLKLLKKDTMFRLIREYKKGHPLD